MAYYKIEENKKGFVAKIQVHSKDIKTGKHKIITKRIYNDKNLTLAKFEKYVERYSMDFEDDVINAYKEQTDMLKSKVLTFEQLGKEFLTNIKANLSMSYYIRAKDVVERFNSYLKDINLDKEPINTIKVRDVQLFLNSLQEYEKQSYGQAKLKKALPDTINFRLLARENIIDRCSSYELKRNRKSISKQKALQICEYCSLNYEEYFLEIDGKRQYSTETLKGYRRVLRTIFNDALRYDWITKNPVCQTKIGAGNNNSSLRPIHEKEVYSMQETKQFLECADKMDDDLINKKTIFKFMILTGVRIGEMRGLKWSDIDFNKKIVHIALQECIAKNLEIMRKHQKQEHL